jgi:hypothetical protein
MPTIGQGQVDYQKFFRFVWTAVPNADTGVPMGAGKLADKTIQVTGTFGGATVTLEGSMNGTDWVTATDANGDPIAMTSAGAALIIENFRFLRPSVAGGGGSTSVTVQIGASALGG